MAGNATAKRKSSPLDPVNAPQIAVDPKIITEPLIRELLELANAEIDPFKVGVDPEYTSRLTAHQRRIVKSIRYHKDGAIAAVDFQTRDDILLKMLNNIPQIAVQLRSGAKVGRGSRIELRESKD